METKRMALPKPENSNCNNSRTSLSKLLIPLFKELELSGQAYCVCGNYMELPYHTDNDVDIWAENPSVVLQLIKIICTDLLYDIYLNNANATGINLFICLCGKGCDEIIHLDILKECRWFSILPLVRSETIKNNRRRYENFYIANTTVETAMHLMYPLAHFGKVTPKYYAGIRDEAKCANFWEIIEEGWGSNFSRKINSAVRNGHWNILERIFAADKANLFLHSLSKIRFAEFRSWLYFLIYNVKRLIKPTGLFIAFIGPDGCGKTTIQTNLDQFFKNGFTKGKIKTFYWRPFLLPRIQSLLPGKKNTSGKTADEEPAERLALRKTGWSLRIIHCIKLFYYWVDYSLGRAKYQGAWSRGGVVCFDRYWEDLYVFPERFGLCVPQWLVEFLGLFVPKPDIIFYLNVKPAVLIDRKPELPLDELVKQTEQYKRLCQRHKNFISVDGEQSRENVLAEVINKCLKTMSKRYQ